MAFTDHDGESGFLLSVGLLQYYGDLEKEARDKFDRLKSQIK